MGEKNPKKVQDELAKLNDGDSENEVAFNPTTGELEIVEKGNVNPDSTVVTDVATDGFAQKKLLLWK